MDSQLTKCSKICGFSTQVSIAAVKLFQIIHVLPLPRPGTNAWLEKKEFVHALYPPNCTSDVIAERPDGSFEVSGFSVYSSPNRNGLVRHLRGSHLAFLGRQNCVLSWMACSGGQRSRCWCHSHGARRQGGMAAAIEWMDEPIYPM